MEKNAFWDTAVKGELSHFEPVRKNADLTRILQLFADERVFELGAGIGFAPSLERLSQWLFGDRRIQLWLITPHGATQPQGLAIYSMLTSVHRIAVFFWDSPLQPPCDLWGDALEALSRHVFAHCACERLFSHTVLPVSPAAEALFGGAGWERWGTTYLLRDPERAVFGLERTVFDLYHAPVEDDEEDLY